MMLDCYICEKSLIVYVYAQFLYVCFGDSPVGEVDKIGNFLKKNSYVYRLCSSEMQTK
jgi:hypothetical protein